VRVQASLGMDHDGRAGKRKRRRKRSPSKQRRRQSNALLFELGGSIRDGKRRDSRSLENNKGKYSCNKNRPIQRKLTKKEARGTGIKSATRARNQESAFVERLKGKKHQKTKKRN